MNGNSERLIHDLTTGSISRQLLVFSAPLFLSGLLQTTYNMVDMIVVGNFVGSVGLAAVTNGGEILNFLTFLAFGFSSAGQIILSQYVGAGRMNHVGRLIGTLITSIITIAVVMTVICLALRNSMLGWINTPIEAWNATCAYVTVSCLGLIFIFGYNMISAIFRGFGDSKHPLLFVAVTSVLNVILDILFIAVAGWGVTGAAIATVISQAVSFIWASIFLYRKRSLLGFDFKLRSFVIDPQIFPILLRLGIPMALQTAAITSSRLFIASWINSYGVIATAVTGIGNKIASITSVFSNAVSTAGSSMIAQNIGACKYERVPRIIGTSMLVDGAVVAVFILITILWPRAIFGLFTSDTAVLDMSALYIPNLIVQYCSCMLRPPMQSLINGSGYAKMNLAVALIDGIFARLGFAILLGTVFGLGIQGLWYGNALASYAPFFIGGLFYIKGSWKTRQYIIKESV